MRTNDLRASEAGAAGGGARDAGAPGEPGLPVVAVAPFAPPARRGGRLSSLATALAVVLVVALAGSAYAAGVVVVAGSERRAADQLLHRTGMDGGQIRPALRPPTWAAAFGTKQDYAQATAAAEDYATAVRLARDLVAADLPALRQASDQLQSQAGSLLLAPERSALDGEGRRVGAALEAFSAADQLLRVSGDQVAFATVLFEAESALLAAEKVGPRSPAAALGQLDQADAQVQQAARLARSGDIPTQLQALTGGLQTLAADYRRYLGAAQAKDQAATGSLLGRVEADRQPLAAFDDRGFQAAEVALFQPYVDRYERAMARAGLTAADGPGPAGGLPSPPAAYLSR